MTNQQKTITVYGLSLGCLALWLGAIFLAPLLKIHSPHWGDFFYRFFSPVCHQISERSFFLFGYPLAVCTRCLGIYTGCLMGFILYPFTQGFRSTTAPPIRLFVLLTSPIAVDTLGNFFSIWITTPWLRFLVGFLWGVILPFYFVTGLSAAWIEIKNKSK